MGAKKELERKLEKDVKEKDVKVSVRVPIIGVSDLVVCNRSNWFK